MLLPLLRLFMVQGMTGTALFVLLLPGALNGQTVRIADGPPQCASCRIQLEHVVRLGRSTDDVSLTPTTAVAAFGANPVAFYLSHTYEAGRIAKYSRSGSFESLVGRPGEGPGEISGVFPPLIRLSGDTLYAVNRERVVVFDARGEHVRTFRLPFAPGSAVLLSDGRLAVTRRPDGSGLQSVQVMSATGGGLQRITFPELEKLSPPARWSLFGLASGRGFWVAADNRYRIERWSPTSNRIAVEREASWFPPYADQPRGAPVMAPSRPLISGVWESAASSTLLWVAAEVPDAQWRPTRIKPDEVMSQDFSSFFDTIVEVLDLGTGRVHAAERFDLWLRPVTGVPDLLYSPGITELGETYVDVWRTILTADRR